MSEDKESSSKMQNISLTKEEQDKRSLEKKEISVTTEKQISKTNSLKRFFKLNYKKIEASSTANVERDVESKDEKKFLECLPDEPRRFHLRLGNRQKHLDSNGSEEPGSSGSSSKLTLKRSINKYWQTLFKGPKSDSRDDIEDTNIVPSIVLKKSFGDENKGEESSDNEEILNRNESNSNELESPVNLSLENVENLTKPTSLSESVAETINSNDEKNMESPEAVESTQTLFLEDPN